MPFGNRVGNLCLVLLDGALCRQSIVLQVRELRREKNRGQKIGVRGQKSGSGLNIRGQKSGSGLNIQQLRDLVSLKHCLERRGIGERRGSSVGRNVNVNAGVTPGAGLTGWGGEAVTTNRPRHGHSLPSIPFVPLAPEM